MFAKVLATIAVILVALIVVYFVTVPNTFDGTCNRAFFLSSVLFFCVIGLIGFFIQKKKNKLSNSLAKGRFKIGELSAMPKPNIYRRTSGETFLKLNEEFHVKAENYEGKWLGDGKVETFDPEEEVEVIQ